MPSYTTEARQRSPRSPTDPTIIPVPVPHGHQSHGYPADRSPEGGRSLVSPSASRSPQPSLSSYRNHPYGSRRHSVSAAQTASSHEDPSRIYLPPPNSAAPLHISHERRDPRDREPRSPLDVRDPHDNHWHDRRPSLPRAQSERYHSERGGLQLPSFASITSAASSAGPLTPNSAPSGTMGPPSALPNISPGSSRATSPKPYASFSGGGLRPSYSYEGPNGGSNSGASSSSVRGHSLGLSIGGNGNGVPNSSYRNDPSPTRYRNGDRKSPPLHPMNGYTHDQYMAPHGPHSHLQVSAQQAGRARSHSAASALSRYGGASSENGDWPGPQTPQIPVPAGGGGGGGQNRRVAHLLSEQKRRESINTGFKALRASLASSVPGDSKAIVLRKAVSHINHLEDLLRQNGIPITSPPAQGTTGASASGAPPPPLTRGDSGSQGDEEENEDDDDDVEMRDTTTGVATLKVEAQALQAKGLPAPQAEWEHVENVNSKA